MLWASSDDATPTDRVEWQVARPQCVSDDHHGRCVACIAGVSASDGLARSTARVDTVTRQRVEAAIEETGYRRNVVARSPAAGSYPHGRLVDPAPRIRTSGVFVHAVNRRCRTSVHALIVGDSYDHVESEKRVTDSLRSTVRSTDDRSLRRVRNGLPFPRSPALNSFWC